MSNPILYDCNDCKPGDCTRPVTSSAYGTYYQNETTGWIERSVVFGKETLASGRQISFIDICPEGGQVGGSFSCVPNDGLYDTGNIGGVPLQCVPNPDLATPQTEEFCKISFERGGCRKPDCILIREDDKQCKFQKTKDDCKNAGGCIVGGVALSLQGGEKPNNWLYFDKEIELTNFEKKVKKWTGLSGMG